MNPFEAFKSQELFVIGDIGLDHYIEGTCDRLSPEAPVPILNPKAEWKKLGLAANVADNIHSLGGGSILFSVIGNENDEAGNEIDALLREQRMKGVLVRDDSRTTPFKTRFISDGHHLLRMDREKIERISVDAAQKLYDHLKFHVVSRTAGLGAVIVQDYAKGIITPYLFTLIQNLCLREHLLLFVDPHPSRTAEYYQGCDVLTPNLKEAQALTHMSYPEYSIEEIGLTLCQRAKCETVLITLGKNGIAHIRVDQEPVIFEATAQQVFDVSGAGDTVIATYAMAICAGFNSQEAAQIANEAAGIVVGKKGTATVSREELESIFAATDQ